MPVQIPEKEKYKAAILYLLNKLGKIEGKKKAYKLFYFLDFDYFEAHDKPFTGEVYTALKMGPAPRFFDAVIEELQKEGAVVIEKEKKHPTHENKTVIYKPKAETGWIFSIQEKKMLDRVAKKYGAFTGKELEDLSHAQAPFNAVALGEIIPYEYAHYRDSDDLS